MHKAHVLKLTKNKKSKKNKKRCVFLPFLPETDIFIPRFCLHKSGGSDNFGPASKNGKNKYWKAAFAYKTAGVVSLPFPIPAILPICNPGLFRYKLKLISEDLYGMLHKKFSKYYISPVATDRGRFS